MRRELQEKPRSFQDLQPTFMREIQNWAKHEQTVELKEILRQNCIHYDGSGPVPSQIHSYLSTNFKELRNLAKDDPALTAKAADRWYVPDPGKAGRPGEAAREGAADGVRDVQARRRNAS